MRYSLLAAVLLSAALLAQSSPATGPEALLEAARAGDRARVVALLDSGVDVNTATRYGVSALGFAAERGHIDIVRLLVERGADVNVADVFYGSRPIDFALRSGRLDIALYLLEHGSQGAVSVLNAGIRRKDAAAVTAALATKQADAAALASARTLAAEIGDAAIAALVNAAAAATPTVPAKRLALAPTLLRSFEGTYQSATSGASVKVAVNGQALTLTADGQAALRLQAIDERRFVADDAPEVSVTFAGRGGIIERMAIVRGDRTLRYEREGYGDATSPAPDPGGASRAAAGSKDAIRPTVTATRGKPLPWPAFRGANASGVADGQGAVSNGTCRVASTFDWKTAIPGLATSSPIVWGDRVIVATASSADDTSFRTGLYGDVKPVDALPEHTYSSLHWTVSRALSSGRRGVAGKAADATPHKVESCQRHARHRRPPCRRGVRLGWPARVLLDRRHAALDQEDWRRR